MLIFRCRLVAFLDSHETQRKVFILNNKDTSDSHVYAYICIYIYAYVRITIRVYAYNYMRM